MRAQILRSLHLGITSLKRALAGISQNIYDQCVVTTNALWLKFDFPLLDLVVCEGKEEVGGEGEKEKGMNTKYGEGLGVETEKENRHDIF